MRDDEKKICDSILREGEIIRDVELTVGGKMVRQYSIKCDGSVYELTKCNGEWVYIHRCI